MVVRLKEAEDMFEKHQPEGKLDGILKLKEFADIIRAMNTKKCMFWGDDPVEIIKREWSNSGGNKTRELDLSAFKTWWPDFVSRVDVEMADHEAAEEAKAAANAKANAEMYSGEGVWNVPIKKLTEAMKEAAKRGKTPLVIDNTTGFRTEVYFTYSNAHVIECKKMVMDSRAIDKGGIGVEAVIEEERNRIFKGRCFKDGRTVMFRLANTACDLKNRFNSETFPTMALLDQNEVQKAMESPENAEKSPFMKMAQTDDESLELKANGIHADFNVVLVTQFPEEDYVEFLKEMIPLDLMQPIKPRED